MKKRTKRTFRPRLRFSAYSWAKLLFLRDLGSTEIAAFGTTSVDDPLLIEDVVLVKQFCTAITVKFDDFAVADFFDEQIDSGRKPEQFARVWIHTHPGDSPYPSHTDEKTFARVFGRCSWAAMAIIARGGESYGRLRFHTPKADVAMGIEVDWSLQFDGSDQKLWLDEYQANVSEEVSLLATNPTRPRIYDDLSRWDQQDFAAAF